MWPRHCDFLPDDSRWSAPPPLRVCLLECCLREVRVVVASILEKTLESALQFEDPGLDNLMDALLSLLDKDVPENVKNCAQYFGLFSNFAQRVMSLKRSGTELQV